MHKDFGEWYRTAGIQQSDETLSKRWTGVAEYKAGAQEVISLTRLFYQLGSPTTEFITEFRAAFHEADDSFPPRDNGHELTVLAGAELVDVMERGSRDIADTAALSLVCAAAQNLRPSPAVPEIPEIAARYLSTRATRRTLPPDHSGEDEPFKSLTALGPPYKQLASEFRNVQWELPVLAEETSVLWWVFSEHSRDLNQPLSKLPGVAVSLIAGKELADLTRVIPGSIAATALLDKVIRAGRPNFPKEIAVVDAVHDLPVDWRRQYVDRSCPTELEEVMPISTGMRLSLGSQHQIDWRSAFEQKTGISSASKISPHILAYQIYLETLLSRSFAGAR